MSQNDTLDPATLMKRQLAIRIIHYGFDDGDLDTVITAGQTAGYVDGLAYSTATPTVI